MTENEAAGIAFTPASLTVNENGSADYEVVLTSKPTGAVAVAIAGAADTDLSLSTDSLTFAPAGWNSAVTVTVTAGEDADAVADRVTLSHTASGGDYVAVSGSLTVTVADNDTAALVFTGAPVTVTEGSSATYTVELDTEPTGEVVVTIGGTADTDLSVDPETLTFTSETWQTAQAVEVTAAEDADAVADGSVTLTHAASGGDYGSVSNSLVVTLAEDDTAGLVFTEAPLTVPEGESATYTVALASKPTAQVVVTISGTVGTDLSVDPDSITFAEQGWRTEQTVTVSADHDDDAVNQGTTLAHLASGGDYDLTKGLAVTIDDDDTRGVTVSKSSLTISEGGTNSYTVVLDTAPSGPVTVTPSVTGSSDVTVPAAALTFTATTWDDEQTVTVSAGEDADAVNDLAAVSHAVAGGDYGSVSADEVAVTVDDDETAAPALTVELGEPEHDDLDGTVTVTLGDVLSYTATASNSGNVPLSGVRLSDLLVNSTGQECGTLAIGGSCEISGDYPVRQADVDAGTVANTVTGTATEVSGEVTASRSTAVAQERELTLVKSATESGFGGTGRR